jgi:hypothetical protein
MLRLCVCYKALLHGVLVRYDARRRWTTPNRGRGETGLAGFWQGQLTRSMSCLFSLCALFSLAPCLLLNAHRFCLLISGSVLFSEDRCMLYVPLVECVLRLLLSCCLVPHMRLQPGKYKPPGARGEPGTGSQMADDRANKDSATIRVTNLSEGIRHFELI